MDKWSNKVAVVTGANSGIGYAVTKKLALAGLKVVGLDIEIDAIDKLKEELKDAKIYSKKCDVTKDDCVTEAFEYVETLGGVDVLVNTARTYRNIGVLDYEKPVSELAYNIDVDFVGAVRTARLAFKSMETRDSYGYIININSNFSNLLTPMSNIELGVYSGACSAISTTSNVMRYELNRLKNRKVRVTNLNLGVVKNTNIFKIARLSLDDEKTLYVNPTLVPEDLEETVAYLLALPYGVNVSDMTIRATGADV
ncbi:farnesol dehydrogenase-like [Chironomus tepperi]|uniref:farnesol dehydrogenase-like n=1 Tax=Chironomus tepperi TaxID=113505 RepID=UPI00391F900E